ncbi:hypothetical protein OAE61_00820 [Verrucomicrobiales bacterium]|nr:hypothetical protein [Verrucomicrobiales bacterium]
MVLEEFGENDWDVRNIRPTEINHVQEEFTTIGLEEIITFPVIQLRVAILISVLAFGGGHLSSFKQFRNREDCFSKNCMRFGK